MPMFFHITKTVAYRYTCKECRNSILQWMEMTSAHHTWSKTIKVLECSILSQKKKKKADKT